MGRACLGRWLGRKSPDFKSIAIASPMKQSTSTLVFALLVLVGSALQGSELEWKSFKSAFPLLSEEFGLPMLDEKMVRQYYAFSTEAEGDRLEVEVWCRERVTLTSKDISPAGHVFVRSRRNSDGFKESSFAAEYLIRVRHYESDGSVMMYLDTYNPFLMLQMTSMIAFDEEGSASLAGYFISSGEAESLRLLREFRSWQ